MRMAVAMFRHEEIVFSPQKVEVQAQAVKCILVHRGTILQAGTAAGFYGMALPSKPAPAKQTLHLSIAWGQRGSVAAMLLRDLNGVERTKPCVLSLQQHYG